MPNVIDPSGLWGERPEQWGDCVPSDDCYCYEGQNNLNAFLCRIGEIPTCTDVYAGTVDMSPRQMAVRAILRYLQDLYGAFPNPSVWNPENMDCEKNTRSSRGLEDFILLSNEVATRTNNNLDDYLYVMNSIILRYPTSGDMSVVASVAYSRSWARGFCLGAGGLSREYDDGSPNQISTHIWSFIATTASPMSSIGWVTGNIGNIIHDPLQSIVGRILTSLGRPNDIAEGTSWTDYLASITGMVLGQRLRSGQVSPEGFGEAFRNAMGGNVSFWDVDGCEECKRIYGPYAVDWLRSQFPIMD